MIRPLTVGSLFTGIGGFDLGLERAGMQVKWQVEIDLFCRAVLAKHWPNVKRLSDIREAVGYRFDVYGYIDAHAQKYLLDPVDLICGGFPCKQTSRAAAIHGRRVGLAGRDSGLWREMLRIIGELQPGRCLVENPDSEWLGEVSGDLESLGYAVSRTAITAAGIGAPHLRRRVLILADRDRARLAKSWPVGSSEISSPEWLATQRDAWLSRLSGVVRVDDGIPGGLHRRQRVHACGNAIVPDVAEWIGRRIVEAEAATVTEDGIGHQA